jgi:hypothetical protein
MSDHLVFSTLRTGLRVCGHVAGLRRHDASVLACATQVQAVMHSTASMKHAGYTILRMTRWLAPNQKAGRVRSKPRKLLSPRMAFGVPWADAACLCSSACVRRRSQQRKRVTDVLRFVGVAECALYARFCRRFTRTQLSAVASV